MKAYLPLQAKFRELNESTANWHKSSKFPKTPETANSILYRDAVVDASTLAYLAHCLGMTNKKIASILAEYALEVPKKADEVAVLMQLIAPVDLSKEEQAFIIRLRDLPTVKRQLVYDLVRSLS